MEEEMSFHLEMQIDQNLSSGMAAEEARYAARRQFGNQPWLKEASREMWRLNSIETLIQDLRYGVRMLLKNPGFTLITVITLSLGIGANTAIFSVVNAVLLRPLPYLNAERFIVVESGDRTKGPEQMGGVAPGNYWEMREEIQSFEEIFGLMGSGYSFKDKENPENAPGFMVTPGFFHALRARPLLGRAIEERDTCDNCPGVMVLSHRLWMRRFGGDPNIVGKKLEESGVQVIGVMPADFRYPANSEVWQPLPNRMQAQDRASRYFQVYGLLKPGAPLDQARAEMRLLAARFEKEYPKENKNLGFTLTPFRDRLTRDVRSSLFVMLAAVGFVLLIACANVANLLLAKAVARRKELAVRAALGASRWRLARQILSETLSLAAVSAMLGWLLAVWARVGLLKIAPRTYAYLQLEDHLRLDWRVLVFTLSLTTVTALLFSLLPAWQVSQPEAGEFLKEAQRGAEGTKTRRARSLLVVAEVSLALVLLIGAGLLINSFLRLQRVQLGFDPQNLFAVNLNVPMRMTQAEKARLIQQLQEAVAILPDVEAVAVTTGYDVFPYLSFQMNRPDKPLPADEPVMYDVISPNYFTALRGALVKGRYFTAQDTDTTEPIAIINERLARKYFGDEDPLDKTITLNYLGRPQQRRIIGVVRDMSQGELVKTQPQLYVPFTQQTWFGASLVVRARASQTAALRSVQQALWTVDPKQPVSKLKTAEELLEEKLDEPRLYTTLLGLFAALALILAIVGVVGVMSYNVTHRTREIGVRMALGAQASDVARLVVGQGMRLVLAGALVGVLASFALTQLMKGLLFGVSATDPLTFAAVAFLLTSAALLACWIPARRATKVDPMVALRID
ncbi:MAG: ABC transporter permease [Chloracidobacterium sp.]|nr:ABC transporter permease [Chloracidobacterium sp.]